MSALTPACMHYVHVLPCIYGDCVQMIGPAVYMYMYKSVCVSMCVYGFHDNSSTGISSTTVYQRTGQLYIQLLFQQIIIFINSNFYLHFYDSILSIPLPLTL